MKDEYPPRPADTVVVRGTAAAEQGGTGELAENRRNGEGFAAVRRRVVGRGELVDLSDGREARVVPLVSASRMEGEPKLPLRRALRSDDSISPEGQLLTLPDSDFGRLYGQAVQDHLALFDSGEAYMTADATHFPEVQAALDMAIDVYKLEVRRIIIDAGRLKALYHRKAEATARQAGLPESMHQLRRDVLDVITSASEMPGLHDLIIKYSPETDVGGRVVAMIDGVQTPFYGESGSCWTPKYCLDWMKALWAWAHDGAGEAEQTFEERHQVGQLSKGLPEKLDSIRVQTLQCGFGEKEMILRFMPRPTDGVIRLDELGYSPYELRQLTDIMAGSRGIVIITGPTGSGKTTSLHGMINLSLSMSRGDRWLLVEDPIEIRARHNNITQLSIINTGGSEEGFETAYRDALRVSMRSIPKKLGIGEIRNRQTAQIAVEASETGHQVLTSLHCDSALGAVPRLREMSIAVEVLRNAETIRAVIAQRLLRELCPRCKREVTQRQWQTMYPLWDPEWLREVFRDRPHIFVENPDGCPRQDGEALTCRGGFKVGRVVLVEILRTSDKMLNLMLGGHHDMAMDAWRREAEDRQDKEFVYFAKPGDIMFREPLTLRDKAIAGVREGRFSPIEVARCINI